MECLLSTGGLLFALTSGMSEKCKARHDNLMPQVHSVTHLHPHSCVLLGSLALAGAACHGCLGEPGAVTFYRYHRVRDHNWLGKTNMTLYNLIFSGTCTIIKGPGGDSCAYFVRSFFPGFPYFVIVFCYVKIIRSVKATRRISHIIQNSVKFRRRTGEQSSRETTRRTNRQILYFKTDDKDLQQTTIKG